MEKFLNLTGLNTLWNKIKTNYVSSTEVGNIDYDYDSESSIDESLLNIHSELDTLMSDIERQLAVI